VLPSNLCDVGVISEEGIIGSNSLKFAVTDPGPSGRATYFMSSSMLSDVYPQPSAEYGTKDSRGRYCTNLSQTLELAIDFVKVQANEAEA
jgi:hypothetical protein